MRLFSTKCVSRGKQITAAPDSFSHNRNLVYIHPKSFYVSRAVSNFHVTEIEIWAGFGPVGSTEKKIEPIMSNFLGRFLN